MHEMSNNFLMMKNPNMKSTENLWVKNPNSLDKIQHYGKTASKSKYIRRCKGIEGMGRGMSCQIYLPHPNLHESIDGLTDTCK